MSLKYGKWVRGGKPATKKFDMLEPPHKQAMYFMPLVWAFSDFQKNLHRARLHKINMEGIKPPYILICNHNAFFDFYIMSRMIMPDRGYFPAAVDDYIGREWPLRRLGAIPKRKFTADLSIIRNCKKAIQDKQIFGIYAEARYSHCGKTEVIPDSVGQLCKYQNVPVVTLKMSGHHLYQPFWNSKRRYIKPVEATMTCIYKPEELKTASADEINAKIREYLYNDDFRWQYENKIRIPYKNRAKGLHKVLYQCPACKAEHEMASEGTKLFCKKCGKVWEMTELGELKAENGETEFSHVPDWYEWERANVKAEIERGEYSFSDTVEVYSLPRPMKFEKLGSGKLTHDPERGFVLTGEYRGEKYRIQRLPLQSNSLHVEYDFPRIKPYDCVDISTESDSFYCYPTKQNVITKLAFATEIIYEMHEKKSKLERAERAKIK